MKLPNLCNHTTLRHNFFYKICPFSKLFASKLTEISRNVCPWIHHFYWGVGFETWKYLNWQKYIILKTLNENSITFLKLIFRLPAFLTANKLDKYFFIKILFCSANDLIKTRPINIKTRGCNWEIFEFQIPSFRFTKLLWKLQISLMAALIKT